MNDSEGERERRVAALNWLNLWIFHLIEDFLFGFRSC